jgi:hypothetical protein
VTARPEPDVPASDVPSTDVPFAEPWQARVFATAVLTCERLGRPWDDFRDELKAAIGEEPQRPYFESFTIALERLVAASPRGSPGGRPARSSDGVGG